MGNCSDSFSEQVSPGGSASWSKTVSASGDGCGSVTYSGSGNKGSCNGSVTVSGGSITANLTLPSGKTSCSGSASVTASDSSGNCLPCDGSYTFTLYSDDGPPPPGDCDPGGSKYDICGQCGNAPCGGTKPCRDKCPDGSCNDPCTSNNCTGCGVEINVSCPSSGCSGTVTATASLTGNCGGDTSPQWVSSSSQSYSGNTTLTFEAKSPTCGTTNTAACSITWCNPTCASCPNGFAPGHGTYPNCDCAVQTCTYEWGLPQFGVCVCQYNYTQCGPGNPLPGMDSDVNLCYEVFGDPSQCDSVGYCRELCLGQ